MKFVEAKGISMINFRYAAEDGKLKAFNDKDLSERIYDKPEEISKLVKQFLHCS